MGSLKKTAWFTPTLETISESQKDLFQNYSHIAEARIIPHILAVRDRAWETHQYPCIGQLRFIDLSLCYFPSYPSLLTRLKNGASYLDLGCCVGQDIRKLVHDGAPATQLWGAELVPEFISIGYELFCDQATLGAHLMEADIFEAAGPLKELENKIDIVHVGRFLHLFDWEGQRRVCERIVGILKKERGVMILGQQAGGSDPGIILEGTAYSMYMHTRSSFEKLWKEVGDATGSKWKVVASLDGGLGVVESQWSVPVVADDQMGFAENRRMWDDTNTKRLRFEVERVD